MAFQIVEALPKDHNTTYLIVILSVFIAEKVINMSLRAAAFLKGKNGKGDKDETREIRTPCLQGFMNNPIWDSHRQETRDTSGAVARNEKSLGILKKESLLQTVELKAQTYELKSIGKTLTAIAKNGSQEKD